MIDRTIDRMIEC